MQPGEPVQAIANKDGKDTKVEVLAQGVKDGNHGIQDISGWIAMPPSHWKVVDEQLTLDRKLAAHREFQEWVRKVMEEEKNKLPVVTVPLSNSTPPK